MKILKNKRGFSLVELMVVVAIMGVLSAIAIPSYLTYQENAKEGVVESMLHLVDRTVSIESSLGNSLATIKTDVATRIWGKVRSNDKNKFADPDATNFTVAGDQWCMQIVGDTSPYDDYQACISNNKDGEAKVLAAAKTGSSLDCSKAIARTARTLQQGGVLAAILCPSTCTAPTAPAFGETAPCEAGGTGSKFTVISANCDATTCVIK